MLKINSPEALVVSIAPLVQRAKTDTTTAKILNKRDEMTHGPPQTVQPPDYENITALQQGETFP